MKNLTAFEESLVNLVRKMPDEVLLKLIKNNLGAEISESASKAAAAPKSQAPKPNNFSDINDKLTEVAKERMKKIEGFISAHNGVATSEIVKGTGLPRSAVALTLMKLRTSGRIRMDGNRSTARYYKNNPLPDKK